MKKKKIHFVGIKGVGMTALAIIAKEAGFVVTGSDVADEFITDVSLKEAGIVPLVGFSSDHIGGQHVVITTGAHGGFSNVEVVMAKQKGIPVLTQGEAVGAFMAGELFDRAFTGISVAGTHGKTTTTAMIATIFSQAGLDPSYVIGTASVGSLRFSGHYGKGKFFIAEADEYATEPTQDKTPKFLWQHPHIAVFTNIEYDHPDIYENVQAVYHAFLQFAAQIPSNGILLACGDDQQIRQLLKEYPGTVITYGFSPVNDFVITRTKTEERQMFFWVETQGVTLGEFSVQVSGEHNALNALAALLVAKESGIDFEKAKKGLALFTGSKRRFELVGELPTGAIMYDDYAHHPTEIITTLKAFKQSFPRKKIVCIFQPHTYSRTKELFNQFIPAFDTCDEVVIMDIYASRREVPDPSISAKQLVEKILERRKEVIFLPTHADVVEYIKKRAYDANAVLVTMGAGDVYSIAHELIKN